METKIATLENLGVVVDGEDAEWVAPIIDKYLSSFCIPKDTPEPDKAHIGGVSIMGWPCVNCEKPLTGLFGHFQWGLAHGEGYCSKCGWPARGCHYITLKRDDQEGEFQLGGPGKPFVLQFAEHAMPAESVAEGRRRREKILAGDGGEDGETDGV